MLIIDNIYGIGSLKFFQNHIENWRYLFGYSTHSSNTEHLTEFLMKKLFRLLLYNQFKSSISLVHYTPETVQIL